MVFSAYIDDSGSEPSARTFVLAGFVLPAVPQPNLLDGKIVPSWTAFSEEWTRSLHSPPRVEYLKMSEVWDKQKGPFAKLNDEERKAKVAALAKVIAKHHPIALSVRIDWDQWRAFSAEYPMPRDKDNPYFFLFYRIIRLMAEYGEHYANDSPVNFTFDYQNQTGIKTKEWYGTFVKQLEPQYRKYLGNEPFFEDEKKVVALQSADMLAWYLRREALNSSMSLHQQEISTSLRKYLSEVEPLTVQILQQMANDMRVKKGKG